MILVERQNGRMPASEVECSISAPLCVAAIRFSTFARPCPRHTMVSFLVSRRPPLPLSCYLEFLLPCHALIMLCIVATLNAFINEPRFSNNFVATCQIHFFPRANSDRAWTRRSVRPGYSFSFLFFACLFLSPNVFDCSRNFQFAWNSHETGKFEFSEKIG